VCVADDAGLPEAEHRCKELIVLRECNSGDLNLQDRSGLDRVSVCVCTYQRTVLLSRLLDALATQETGGAFAFDVVVIDNDANRSSEEVVRQRAATSLTVAYDVEPERNISLARNRAIGHATGNLVALIDDDEYPQPNWLQLLYETLKSGTADGVLAPVVPEFPANAPKWLAKGGVFQRQRHSTGTSISVKDARTGNALLKRSIFPAGQVWFDPAFGRTGGEDTDFFSRQFRDGRTFVWCDEAVLKEDVPEARLKASFHLKRLWRSGTITGERIRDGRLPSSLLIKNVLAMGVWAAATIASVLLPKHLRLRVAQKLAYCAGVVTAYCGWSLLRQRE
jgi:succinoglycan biosynthesis protein ExoM